MFVSRVCVVLAGVWPGVSQTLLAVVSISPTVLYHSDILLQKEMRPRKESNHGAKRVL